LTASTSTGCSVVGLWHFRYEWGTYNQFKSNFYNFLNH